MDKFGRNNFKFTGEGMSGVLKSDFEKQFLTCTNNQILNKIKPVSGITTLPKKKAEEFILNNEITFDDNSGKGKLTYVFEENGYTVFKNEKKIDANGWKWNNIGQLRVIMDGEKTTWRIAKSLQALSIKYKGTEQTPIPYFFEWESKSNANARRIAEKKEKKKKELLKKKE